MPFAIGVALALVLVPVAIRAGLAAGLVDRAADPSLAIHAHPVPVLGGPAIVGAALGAVALLDRPLPGSVVAAVLVALAAGLADDLRQLPPIVRLLLLVGAGAVLASGGVRLAVDGPIGALAVVALVTVCANATNLLDGQNGLAGGLGAIASLGLAAVAANGSGVEALGLALAGALVSFLAFNLPGRIFLGNGGAYGLGALLAALAAGASSADGWRGVVAVSACLGVFALELCLTIGRRLVAGSSLTSGDRLHSYDILAERTGSRLRSTATMCAGGAIAAGIGIGIGASHLPLGGAVGLLVAGSAAGLGWARWNWTHRAQTGRDELPASSSS